MDERDPLESLRDLEKGLDRARQERRNATAPGRGGLGLNTQNAIGQGLRIGVELVVAVVVGAGIGWACDRWLGTRPWGMIGFFFLGVAAGLVNVYRAFTGMGMAIGYRRGDAPAAKLGFDDEDED